MRRFLTLLLALLPLAAAAHGVKAGNATPMDEHELHTEAELAAMIELIGPPGDADPAKLGQKSFFATLLRWPGGKTVTVCMQQRSKPLRTLIARVAMEWLKRKPNIFLDFGSLDDPRRCDDPSAPYDIRVADNPDSPLSPFWSWIGQEALQHRGEWTMDLGFGDGADRDAAEALVWAAAGDTKSRNYFHFLVLHEFGHALGALHEHQFGTCAAYLIPDRAVAEVFPSATTPQLQKAALANLQTLTRTQINAWGAVRETSLEDPLSVMRYYFPADIYRTGAPRYCSGADMRHVSDGDLTGLGKVYPAPGHGAGSPATVAALSSLLNARNSGLSDVARQRLLAARQAEAIYTAPPGSASDPGPAAAPVHVPPLSPQAIMMLNQLAPPSGPQRKMR